jgi:hypothetical protein
MIGMSRSACAPPANSLEVMRSRSGSYTTRRVVEKVGIDPIITARTLWLETHPSLWPKDDAQIGSLQG